MLSYPDAKTAKRDLMRVVGLLPGEQDWCMLHAENFSRCRETAESKAMYSLNGLDTVEGQINNTIAGNG